MRLLVLILSLALVSGALAEDKPKPRSTVKQLDKASPLMSTSGPDDADSGPSDPQTRAQDYNSSRSNTTSAVGDRADDLGRENRCSMGRLDCDDDGDSVPTTVSCGNNADDDCDSAIDEKAAPANHNTTRSNRIQPVSDHNDPVVRKKPGK